MKLRSYIMFFAVCSAITQSHAGPTISEFMDSNKGQAYFNCAYKGKKASKKCLVTNTTINSNAHPVMKQIYGANTTQYLMTIKWPDGDTSRYVTMDSFELGNLNDKKLGGYRLRTTEQCSDGWCLELSRGLIIDTMDSDEYVRLW